MFLSNYRWFYSIFKFLGVLEVTEINYFKPRILKITNKRIQSFCVETLEPSETTEKVLV